MPPGGKRNAFADLAVVESIFRVVSEPSRSSRLVEDRGILSGSLERGKTIVANHDLRHARGAEEALCA